MRRILFLICGILLAWALPALGATDTAQKLLNELIQPRSANPRSTLKADVPSVTPGLEALVGSAPQPLALDNLKDENVNLSELRMPDDLPPSDLPLTLNSQVEYFIKQFQGSSRASFTRWLIRSTRYIPMMKLVLHKEGLPEDLVYLAMIESGFTLNARSIANAVGPWQFMSGTGRRYSLRIDRWIDERRDPVKATVAAAMYLKDLSGMFNGDWYLAAAGYNAGENKIFRAIDRYNTSDFWELTKGSYLKRETKEYVPKLLAATIVAKDPARYGFTEVAAIPQIEFDTVRLPGQTDLNLVARLCGTTYQTIRELNPALRQWATPPDYPNFELRIPKGTRQRFEAAYRNIPEADRFSESPSATRQSRQEGQKSVARKREVRYYTVRKGDTLKTLARRFKVSTRLLTAWNKLRLKTALAPGKRLIVAKHVVEGTAKA